MLYEITVPEAGFSVTEGTIIKWHKKVGDNVEEGETVVSVETDKIVVEIPSQCTGVLVEIKHEVGETVPTGAVLAIVEGEGDQAAAPAAKAPAASAPAQEKKEGKAAPEAMAAPKLRNISPLAKDMAKKLGVDLSQIEVGSGPGGRIVKEDVLKLAEEAKASPAEKADPKEAAQPQQRVPLKGWRKVIADRMVSSARNVPQVSILVETDVTEIANLIKAGKAQKDPVRLTYLPFIMKALQVALKVAPEINAYCYDEEFVLQNQLNIGVAVELGEKLLVPVVKNAAEKNILELANDVRTLAKKARDQKLDPDDVEGGTITITNLGPLGADAAMPLILQPQTTIIGTGAVKEVLAKVDGSIEVRQKMMITGVFDHRVINGAAGARFLSEVKKRLEDPKFLLLMMR